MFRERLIQLRAADRQDFTDQRIAVGMRAGGSQTQQQVARRDPRPVDDPALLDHADAEAGQVVVARAVQPRHLGGFAAHQRRAGLSAAIGDALDHGGGHVHIQFAGGVIIEEEQGLGPDDQHVVDAHRHQIDADGVVAAQIQRQFELGADAIGAGHQHRLAVAVQRQFEQRAKTAQPAQHSGPEGALGVRLDAVHQPIAGFDVHPGVAVAEGGGVRKRVVHGWLTSVWRSGRALRPVKKLCYLTALRFKAREQP